MAINHSPEALALHAANHPDTRHLITSIYAVDPTDVVTPGQRVGLAWFSPDCKHFSKAKGGRPVSRNIRDLAWVVVHWAEKVRPEVILLENVEEFVTWGPLRHKHVGGRPWTGGPIDGDLWDSAPPEVRGTPVFLPNGEPHMEPCPLRSGQTFRTWVLRLRRLGYRVEWRELRACDYGAPTIRKRLFVVARCDGRPITWPKPTHGDPESEAVRSGTLKPWRTAADCIDWSLPCPSIFDSAAQIMGKYGLRAVRPLAPATQARIARGMKRYVLEAEKPFLIGVAHSAGGGHREYPGGAAPLGLIAPVLTYAQQGGRNRSAIDPLHTVTASTKDQNAVIVPALVQTGYGERPGQAPRALDPHAPLGTIVAGGVKHAPAAVFLAQQNGGPRMDAHAGHGPREPLSTVAGTGSHQTPVAAFFAKYYGTGDGARTDAPCHTTTTRDRFAHVQAALQAPPFGPEHEERAREVAAFLRAHGAWEGGEFVTLAIGGTEFVVVDIGMRMLTPRELFRAQGLPDDYVIEGTWEERHGEWNWHAFPKNVQISCCGNSVCPPVAAALVNANCRHLIVDEVAA